MNRFDRLINHPGRNIALQCIDYICIAATPPSKGGETYTIISFNKTMRRLTAMRTDGERPSDIKSHLMGFGNNYQNFPNFIVNPTLNPRNASDGIENSLRPRME
jgi:hypothetical protein